MKPGWDSRPGSISETSRNKLAWIAMLPLIYTPFGKKQASFGDSSRFLWLFPVFAVPSSVSRNRKTPCLALCENGVVSSKLVHPAGLEPTTYCSGGSRSIQMSYGCTSCTRRERRPAFCAKYNIPRTRQKSTPKRQSVSKTRQADACTVVVRGSARGKLTPALS